MSLTNNDATGTYPLLRNVTPGVGAGLRVVVTECGRTADAGLR